MIFVKKLEIFTITVKISKMDFCDNLTDFSKKVKLIKQGKSKHHVSLSEAITSESAG